jgi:glycine dehydrogenase subunit 1
MGSYVPTTAAEREEMLAAIGVDSLEGLYKAVPQEMLLRSGGLNIPEGLSELEVREAVTANGRIQSNFDQRISTYVE